MALQNAHVVCYLREEYAGWYEQTLEADHWASLGDIAPTDAAMLLCRFNPHAETFESAKLATTDELQPEHLIRLAERLEDIGKADNRTRTLRDWHQTAIDKGLVYHSWIDGYMEATAPLKVPEQTEQTPDPERRLARLCALGGTAKFVQQNWKFTGIVALVDSEKRENRKRSDEKTIRADLRDAARAEQDAKRAGFESGLGQR